MTTIDRRPETHASRPARSSDAYAITLSGNRLKARTFLLGNEGGFVLYLPVEQNIRDRTLMPIKWFGASEFGRKYLESNLVWATVDGKQVKLDRSNQTGFVQYLDSAVRTFQVGNVTLHQRFLVPDGMRAVIMIISGGDLELAVEPEFDMRYYQAFNSDFSGYRASVPMPGGTPCLSVSNRISGPPTVEYLEFHAYVRAVHQKVRVELLPEAQRLRQKTYLKDEMRDKLIHSAYAETHEIAPDEAPLWDLYSTTVYAPARIIGRAPLTLVYGFGGSEDDADWATQHASADIPRIAKQKAEDTLSLLTAGELETGRVDIDTAYAQVLARFDNALVARDVTVHAGEREIDHFSAIFAGNKYFLDAWKRDENISLIGLLVTNQYETVRAILDQTWSYQDPRTGRLPQIIRLGEPLVYFSSDGTLWALRRLAQYTHMSGDRTLLDAKYQMVEHFFAASLGFVQRGLLPSGGVIDRAYLWETWEDTPYTPRNGYPVEIELLWLTALQDYLPIVRERNPKLAARMEATLAEGRETFKLFHLDGYLADSLSYQWQPQAILTPNGYVAFALGYPLPDALMRSMVLLAREQLAGHAGVLSLARRDWAGTLSKDFLADAKNFHHGHMASVGLYNYHRGVEWLWLNQFLVMGELQCGDTDKAYWTYLSGQVHSALHESGVGGLSELYDFRGPLGADFQAWSMAGFVNSLHAFAGLEVDAVTGCVRARPAAPSFWPYLRCRRKIGSCCLELYYHRVSSGEQVVELRALDEPPAQCDLHLGVRLPFKYSRVHVTLNGAAVPREAVQLVPGCAADAEGEAWIETKLRQRVVASFRPER